MKRNKLRVTNSEMGRFRSCKHRWWFEYHELLRPKRVAKPLKVGRCIHKGLDALYKTIGEYQRGLRQYTAGDDITEPLIEIALASMREELSVHQKELFDRIGGEMSGDAIDAIVAESEQMELEAEGSVERFATRFAMEDMRRYKIVAVEAPFSVPVRDAGGYARPRITYSGVWDGVVYDPELKDFPLQEHKSSAQDATLAERKLDMDPQTTGYIYALHQALAQSQPPGQAQATRARILAAVDSALGLKLGKRHPARVGRVFYNVVRKKGPNKPKVNKDGTVSVASCDTTRDVYEQALVTQENSGGKDGKGTPRTDKQIAKLESLPQSFDKYVCRHEAFHSPHDVERWRGEMLADSTLVRRAVRGEHPLSRNPEICNMPWSMPCPYRSLCIEDAPEKRAGQFNVVDDPHVEVVEAEEDNEL